MIKQAWIIRCINCLRVIIGTFPCFVPGSAEVMLRAAWSNIVTYWEKTTIE